MRNEPTPRLAKEEDYPEILALLDRVFNYGTGGMAAHIPNWFDESHPEIYAVIERDGHVVSTIGCLPQTFVVGGGEVEWYGIGNVATDAAYRGNGYMTELLEFWLEHLQENEIPLAELGGDTKRYNRFGWENAGREYTYSLSERTFPERSPTCQVRRYQGTNVDIDQIMRMHESEMCRVKRTREGYRELFDQHGLTTLLCTGEAGEAYLSFNQEAPSGRYSTHNHQRIVPEFGGTVDGLHALFDHLWNNYGFSWLGVPVHSSHPRNEYLRDVSTNWTLSPHRMVNILDLAGALDGFIPQMSDSWDGTDGSVTLEITDSDDPPVTISYSATEASVEESPSGEPDIALDRLEMTQFLFGFPDVYPQLRSQDPFLSEVLPLDFYIWRIEGP